MGYALAYFKLRQIHNLALMSMRLIHEALPVEPYRRELMGFYCGRMRRHPMIVLRKLHLKIKGMIYSNLPRCKQHCVNSSFRQTYGYYEPQPTVELQILVIDSETGQAYTF